MTTVEENDSQAKDACNKFWEYIESETGSHIPMYIRNLLKLNGFNSAMSIKLLDEEDLKEIENMVQTGAIKNVVPNATDLKEYLGPFNDTAEHFSFLRGYKKMLLSISSYVRDKGPENVGKNIKPVTVPEMFINRFKGSRNDSKSVTLTSQSNTQGTVTGSKTTCK